MTLPQPLGRVGLQVGAPSGGGGKVERLPDKVHLTGLAQAAEDKLGFLQDQRWVGMGSSVPVKMTQPRTGRPALKLRLPRAVPGRQPKPNNNQPGRQRGQCEAGAPTRGHWWFPISGSKGASTVNFTSLQLGGLGNVFR